MLEVEPTGQRDGRRTIDMTTSSATALSFHHAIPCLSFQRQLAVDLRALFMLIELIYNYSMNERFLSKAMNSINALFSSNECLH